LIRAPALSHWFEIALRQADFNMISFEDAAE
jgi:hypothetical protein